MKHGNNGKITKVLIIDDDPATTDLLRIIIEPSQAVVFTSNHALEGITCAKEHQPDVVLLDLMMPTMNGVEVVKNIREFSSAAIIMMSAIDCPETIVEALDAGADDYLVKPINGKRLITHINSLTRRTSFSSTIALDYPT
jgi:two-component system response regulator MtrA